jgi:sugar phosphate permease
MSVPIQARPTHLRIAILVLATAVALLLYLDRYCLGVSDNEIAKDMKLTPDELAWIRGSFFLTYALGQIPMGRLSDRFGVRHTLALFMIVWSAFTGLIGVIVGFVDFLIYRLGCGLFEAGAYPACAGMIRRWFPDSSRGIASGIVSLGGRLGGTVTPLVVPTLIFQFGWQPVLIGLGLFGIGLGVFFVLFYRNRPREHPLCNEAEVHLIESDQAAGADTPSAIPWLRLLTHVNLWLCSIVQFGINFGWVFIIIGNFADYLRSFPGVEAEDVPFMVFCVMIFNLPALIVGGKLTDRLTSRLGKRWGRAIPMGMPRLLSGGCYFLIPLTLWLFPSTLGQSPWTVVVLMGLMTFFSDMCLPAIWGFNLDVGKRHVGVVLGWGNMWGNLGAFFTPLAVNIVQHAFGWPAIFVMFGCCFLLIGVLSLLLNAEDSLEMNPAKPNTM